MIAYATRSCSEDTSFLWLGRKCLTGAWLDQDGFLPKAGWRTWKWTRGVLPNHACPVKLDVQPKSELQGLGNQNMVLGVLYSQIQ